MLTPRSEVLPYVAGIPKRLVELGYEKSEEHPGGWDTSRLNANPPPSVRKWPYKLGRLAEGPRMPQDWSLCITGKMGAGKTAVASRIIATVGSQACLSPYQVGAMIRWTSGRELLRRYKNSRSGGRDEEAGFNSHLARLRKANFLVVDDLSAILALSDPKRAFGFVSEVLLSRYDSALWTITTSALTGEAMSGHIPSVWRRLEEGLSWNIGAESSNE
jgi:DNA replication protein DnaC